MASCLMKGTKKFVKLPQVPLIIFFLGRLWVIQFA